MGHCEPRGPFFVYALGVDLVVVNMIKPEQMELRYILMFECNFPEGN